MKLFEILDAMTQAGPDRVSSILWLLFGAGIIMAIHELGHVIAIKLVGLNIHHVEIGALRLGKLTLGFVPAGISAPDGYDSLEHNNIGNLKLLLISLGGIIAQAILLLALLPWLDNSYLLCMFYLNILTMILNCLPIKEKRTCSDGMKSLMLIGYIFKNKYALDED